MIYCPECGFKQGAGNKFCVRCGTGLAPEAQSADITGPISMGEVEVDIGDEDWRGGGVASLAVRSGEPAGTVFLLQGERITLGRSPDADIFLDDITVSREHAELQRDGHHFELHDLGSLNGTYVNRERISGDAALRDGDEIQVGKFRLVYFGPDQS